MNYPIEKCKMCERYNHEEDKMRNKLRCMVGCKEYMQHEAQKAYKYNRAVSGEEFDAEILYEHGSVVLGSGAKMQ